MTAWCVRLLVASPRSVLLALPFAPLLPAPAIGAERRQHVVERPLFT